MNKYLTKRDLLIIHDEVIAEFGGKPGIRDEAALEAAIGRLSTGYYDDILEEAAAFMESLAQNHPFVDGNKRVALFGTDIFLRINGKQIDCDNDKAYSFFQTLFEKHEFDFGHLLPWLTKHVVQLK